VSTERSRAVAEKFLAAAAAGDFQTIDSLLHDDVTWWASPVFGARMGPVIGFDFPESGLVSGKASVLGEFVGPVQQLLVPGSQQMRIEAIVAEDDKAVVFMHIDAEVAAGGSYSNDFSVFFTISDDQIVAVREYLDTLNATDKLAS
jgi:ketosteroid isomerase-like protein